MEEILNVKVHKLMNVFETEINKKKDFEVDDNIEHLMYSYQTVKKKYLDPNSNFTLHGILEMFKNALKTNSKGKNIQNLCQVMRKQFDQCITDLQIPTTQFEIEGGNVQVNKKRKVNFENRQQRVVNKKPKMQINQDQEHLSRMYAKKIHDYLQKKPYHRQVWELLYSKQTQHFEIVPFMDVENEDIEIQGSEFSTSFFLSYLDPDQSNPLDKFIFQDLKKAFNHINKVKPITLRSHVHDSNSQNAFKQLAFVGNKYKKLINIRERDEIEQKELLKCLHIIAIVKHIGFFRERDKNYAMGEYNKFVNDDPEVQHLYNRNYFMNHLRKYEVERFIDIIYYVHNGFEDHFSGYQEMEN